MSGLLGPLFIFGRSLRPKTVRKVGRETGRESGMIRPERKVLLELLEPEVEQLGFELMYIEALFDSRPGILRLFIDKEAGITLMIVRRLAGR